MCAVAAHRYPSSCFTCGHREQDLQHVRPTSHTPMQTLLQGQSRCWRGQQHYLTYWHLIMRYSWFWSCHLQHCVRIPTAHPSASLTSHLTNWTKPHPLLFPCNPHTGTAAGQDLNLSLDRVNSNRNFGNKLWNAGKFILFQLEKVDDKEWQRLSAADFSSSSSWQGLCLSDRWIISSLHQVRG